jgi:predicted Mrr-cat superfamily restriction endonuclease
MDNTNYEYDILDIPSDTKYWFIRANSRAEYYDDFLKNNYIAVDANLIQLSTLLDIPQTLRSSNDALKDRYKQLFQDNALELFNKRAEAEKMSDTIRKKEKAAALKRSSYRARIVYHFVEDINIGDFVVIPYYRATKFLIGTIVSNCFENEIDHVEDLDENGESNYAISSFNLKRRVLWIKELPKNKFPDKLSWIESAHQSIFNITKFGNDLNPYIAPIYHYKEKTYARIGVNTEEKISSSSWLDYQLTLKNILGDDLDKVFQKQYVQSPGQIVLFVEQHWWLIPIIWSCLFGDVKYSNMGFEGRFQGVFKYFSKDGKRERKLDLEEKQARINNMNADSVNKLNSNSDESIKLKDKIIKSISNSMDKDEKTKKINKRFTNKVEKKNINISENAQNVDKNKLQKDFKLSNENPGVSIQFESQKDNLIPSEDVSEKEVKKEEKGSEK